MWAKLNEVENDKNKLYKLYSDYRSEIGSIIISIHSLNKSYQDPVPINAEPEEFKFNVKWYRETNNVNVNSLSYGECFVKLKETDSNKNENCLKRTPFYCNSDLNSSSYKVDKYKKSDESKVDFSNSDNSVKHKDSAESQYVSSRQSSSRWIFNESLQQTQDTSAWV